MCPHGKTPSTCLICQALDAGELTDRGVRPEPRTRRSPGWKVAKLGIVAVVSVLVASWLAAILWAAARTLELVAVAMVTGWVCWRLGVRHGRRDPG